MSKETMEWRLRGIPAPLWRRVRDKAGDRLHEVMLELLRGYVDGINAGLSADLAGYRYVSGEAKVYARALELVDPNRVWDDAKTMAHYYIQERQRRIDGIAKENGTLPPCGDPLAGVAMDYRIVTCLRCHNVNRVYGYQQGLLLCESCGKPFRRKEPA